MEFAAFRKLTRIEQTLIGLPFIFSSVLLCISENDIMFSNLFWISPAFLLARISGMAFNQLLDRHFDAKNPRTKDRPIPSGQVTPKQAAFIAWGSLTGFLGIALYLGPPLLYFALFAAFLIAIYSLLKRVHMGCHFVLALIHLLAPIMAWVTLTQRLSWIPVILGAVAFFSILGGEILYSIQDIAFDRNEGLHSLPARFGAEKSVLFAACCHLLTLGGLVILGFKADLNWCFYFCPLILGAYFVHFYGREKWKKLMLLQVNVVVSLVVMAFIGTDFLCDLL